MTQPSTQPAPAPQPEHANSNHGEVDEARPAARRLVGVVPGSLVSGAESVLIRDFVAARDAGWMVRIACSDGPFVERLRSEGIERIAIPDLRVGDGNRFVATLVALVHAAKAGRILRHTLHPRELVMANSINVLPATASVARSNRVIYFGHDVLIRKDRLTLLRLFRRRVHLAVAVSEAVARTIRFANIPTTVIHNGTAWPVEPAPAKRTTGPPVIGIAAVVTPWKGHSVLLDALARMEHRDTILEVMGGVAPKDEPFAEALRRRSEQPDLAGRVRFLGHIETPLERMKTWDVAVLPSTDPEAGPLTALEAMSVGVPVVGTNHGGMVEVIGEAGLLVPPSDARSLAAAVDRLLSDPVLDASCRAAGPRQITANHLTLADHQLRMLDLLDAQLIIANRMPHTT